MIWRNIGLIRIHIGNHRITNWVGLSYVRNRRITIGLPSGTPINKNALAYTARRATQSDLGYINEISSHAGGPFRKVDSSVLTYSRVPAYLDSKT